MSVLVKQSIAASLGARIHDALAPSETGLPHLPLLTLFLPIVSGTYRLGSRIGEVRQ